MKADEAVINRWRGAAEGWEKHREAIRHMFSPVTHALAEAAHIGTGQTVLDVATGPGEPALGLASIVGTEGKVFGIDPIPGMVEAARRAADRYGMANARFEVGFADRLPFPDATFDAVVSRFGAMFFPSPPDALGELLRVLKPGRKLALAVWAPLDDNPFFYAMQRVIDRYVTSPPPAPDDPDAFRFAGSGRLLGLLAAAGATSPSERRFRFPIEAMVSPEEFWTVRYEMSEKTREKLAPLPPHQVAELQQHVIESFREFSTDRGLSFPAEVLIVTGTR